jgi:hypothetical protein
MAKVLDVAKVFDKVGYQPHEVQQRIHRAAIESRFRVVCAGRRTGKSFSGGHELTPKAFEAFAKRDLLDPHGKRMEYWIVGPEYTDAEKEFRALYNDIKKLGMPMDKPGTYYDVNGGNMHLSLWGGRFLVHAKSAKYPDSLVGEGLHGVIMAEAAKLKPSVWNKYVRPMLSDYLGYALMSSTPEGKNWFYEAYMNYQKGLPGWWSIRMPSWSNPYLYPLGRRDPEIIALEAELTPEAFKQEIGAEFTEFVGRVFKEFDEEVHCRPLEYNPNFETYAAVDYGWTNPFVWLLIQVDHWKNVYVIGEHYESHLRIDAAPQVLIDKGLVPNGLRSFFPDPAAPGDSRILADKLNLTAMGGTGIEIKDRLRLIRRHLGTQAVDLPQGVNPRAPKLFVDAKKCPNFVREFNDYRYPKSNQDAVGVVSENPMKKDDHTPEALGRFFSGYFGTGPGQGAPTIAESVMG